MFRQMRPEAEREWADAATAFPDMLYWIPSVNQRAPVGSNHRPTAPEADWQSAVVGKCRKYHIWGALLPTGSEPI